MPATTTIRLRFTLTDGGAKCAIHYRFDTDADWFPFGDPVPVFKSGAIAGFEVHDLYHLTLLAETGWSAVLGILLAGDRGGVFGGPGALAEEAVVMDWFMLAKNNATKSAALLNGIGAGITPAALERARLRGAAAVTVARSTLHARGSATLRIDDIPASFKDRVLKVRQPIA